MLWLSSKCHIECGHKNKIVLINVLTFRTIYVHSMFWACNFHVLNSQFNEQSFVISWVSWYKNKCFWKRFTCTFMLLAHKIHRGETFGWKDIIRQMSYLFLIVLIVPLRNRQMCYLFLIVLFVPLKTRSYFSVVFFSVSASSVNHRPQRSCGRSCHRMWLHWCHRYRIHQNLQEKAKYI